MVLRAGGCNIKLKSLNAERAGAHLVLIIAENDSEIDQMISSSNSMAQVNSDIPTLLVTKAEIASIQSRYLKSKEILLKFQMPLPRYDHVTLDFYILPSDTKIYSFIQSFEEFGVKFEGNLKSQFFFLKSGDENDVLLDKMSQMINCLNPVVLYGILGSFSEFCVTKMLITPQCLQDQIDAVENKYIAEARRCVQKGNTVLSFLGQNGLYNNPAINMRSFVHVNGKEFQGSLKPENLFEAACGGFTHSPDYCLYLNNKYTPNTHYHRIKLSVRKTRIITVLVNIALALFLLLIAAISIYLIYEKLYKQMLDVRTAEIVRQSVIDYQTIKNNE